jgi:biopolymer transport protein ExbD
MSESHRQKAQAADLHQVLDTDTVHHQTSKKKHPKPKGVAQLQLTSMMDVVFQLLIFFILTANFAVDEGVLPADLPQGTPPIPQEVTPPKPPLKIVLRATGIDGVSIWLEGSNADMGDNFEELFTRLNGSRISTQNPNGSYESDYPIVIKPGIDVQWGYVVRTFNAAVRAKYENVSFAQGG